MTSLSAKTLVELKKVRGRKSSTKAAATEKKKHSICGFTDLLPPLCYPKIIVAKLWKVLNEVSAVELLSSRGLILILLKISSKVKLNSNFINGKIIL